MRNSYFKHLLLMLICIIGIIACKNDSKDQIGSVYDPSKPVILHKFMPDSGRFQEKVLLDGENFGLDPNNIKVYFNSKRTPVIGTTGNRLYVTAPRLPGDTCIISVVVGSDSVVYEDKFYYETTVSVNTVAGNGTAAYQDGDLSEAMITPQWVVVDKDDNVFVAHWHSGYYIARLDEENNELITVARDITANVLSADPETGTIAFSTQNAIGQYVSLDPRNFWAPKYSLAKWTDPLETPTNPYNPGSVTNPLDGYLYTHFFETGIMKINPITWEAKLIHPMGGAVNGMTFRPNEPNILYLAMRGTSKYAPNILISVDVTDPENTEQKLNTISAAGHRDGDLEQAQFNDMRMIVSDMDGNIYITDCNNHCIRRVTTDNMVETVLGIPGTRGWKDGGKEVALFNGPTGIGVTSDGTIYVADYGNNRLRKLSIN